MYNEFERHILRHVIKSVSSNRDPYFQILRFFDNYRLNITQ